MLFKIKCVISIRDEVSVWHLELFCLSDVHTCYRMQKLETKLKISKKKKNNNQLQKH